MRGEWDRFDVVTIRATMLTSELDTPPQHPIRALLAESVGARRALEEMPYADGWFDVGSRDHLP